MISRGHPIGASGLAQIHELVTQLRGVAGKRQVKKATLAMAENGGGALGTGRMHGIPQMLECYLQLSGRAGDRQLASASVGLACHSSPHYGGAVVYTAEPQ